jgi:hypothetical protein
MRAYPKGECLELETSWCAARWPLDVDAEASPAALTIRATATPRELAAFAANFILLEFMVILPLKTFKMISNNQKYCQRLCEDLVKEQCIDLLFARTWGP